MKVLQSVGVCPFDEFSLNVEFSVASALEDCKACGKVPYTL